MLPFHPYGLIISLAVLSAYLTVYFRRKKYGFSATDLENLFLYIVPLAIIGARIYHVVDKWGYYQQNLGEIIAVWNGGLGIYGAILGGVFGLFIFLKIYKVDAIASTMTIYKMLDLIIPGLALGQAVGRWGNFFNHEVFGGPTKLPWGWFIPENLRPEFWKNDSYFHPTFAYESLWVFLGFIVLLIVERKMLSSTFQFFPGSKSLSASGGSGCDSSKIKNVSPHFSYGTLTAIYAAWYGVGRFFLEFLRFDTAEAGGVKVAQIISLVLVVWGGGRLYRMLVTSVTQ